MQDNKKQHIVDNEAKIEERRKYLILQKLPRWTYIFQVLSTIISWLVLFFCFRGIWMDIYYYLSGASATMNFPRDIFEKFLIYAIITFLVITVWIFYNKWMFGGRDRRKGFPVPSDEKQAEQYGISMEQLLLMRDSKCLSVGFNEENRINFVAEGDHKGKEYDIDDKK